MCGVEGGIPVRNPPINYASPRQLKDYNFWRKYSQNLTQGLVKFFVDAYKLGRRGGAGGGGRGGGEGEEEEEKEGEEEEEEEEEG